ncbi:MAG: hypothetical protein MK160_00545 [Rhodobacteraceae bacterium]|nr:hypothetical protein [Paracoccaceae bacterium]
MMRFCFCLAFGVVLASAASAEDVTIRGGEHNGFTRLVLSASEDFEWSERKTANQRFEIRLPKSFRLNLNEAFSRISRARVAELVAVDRATLQISLACDCPVRIEDVGRGLVAIDVLDRRASLLSLAAVRPVARPIPKQSRQIAAPELPLVFGHRDLRSTIPKAVALQLDSLLTVATPKAETFQDDLIVQLSEAVAEGVLSANAPLVDLNRAKNIKPEKLDKEKTNAQPLTGCLPSSSLKIHDWSTKDSFVSQLAYLRGKQASQFEGLHDADLTQLVQLYLHFGMGAEARLITNEHTLEGAVIYNAIAAIFDGKPEASFMAFGAQTSCETHAALWGILSQPDDAKIDFVSEISVLGAFDHLPDHLRRIVAPELVRKLSKWGFKPAAQAILTRMSRMSEEFAPELELSAAALLSKNQKQDQAQLILKELARHSDGVSAEALNALIAGGFDPDPEVDADLIALATAHATERRNTSSAQDAMFTDLISALRANEFERAFQGIQDNNVQSEKVLNEALLRVSQDADPARFLRHIELWRQDNGPKPAPKAAAAAARRLLDLGFPELAIQIVATSDADPEERELKLLLAEAHLALGAPEEAELALIGLSGQSADALRSRIRAAMGDHAYVVNTTSEVAPAFQNRSAFLAEDWARLMTADAGILSDFASWAASDVPDDDDLTLRSAQTQLTNSAVAREQLGALLNLTRID